MASFFSGTPKIFHSDKLSSIITNVELWVVTTTLFLVMKFIIDSFGPWYSNNKFMFNTVIFLESFSRRMVPYTLRLMRPSPETKNDFFQVWAVLMVTLQCSVNVGSPYGRSKQTTLISMLSSLWTANLLRGRTVLFLDSLLWIIWLFNAARMVAHFLSSDMASRINQENMRLVSDYMKHEHRHRPQLGDSAAAAVDPVTMSGYRYLVAGEQDGQLLQPQACTCTPTAGAGPPELISFQWHDKIITTESVWSLGDDGLLGTIADRGNRFKDVYLSYALYKLLRRRFCNLPMHEAAESKTRRLVFEGILGRSSSGNGDDEDDYDYERAFRITEVELSLLQDYFYGNHAVVFVNGFPVRRLGLSLALVAALLFVAYPVQLIPSRSDQQPGLKVVTHGVFITYSIISLIVGKEIWEIYIHVFSQWTKVWMLCWYIRKKAPPKQEQLEKVVRKKLDKEQLERVVRAALEKVVRVMFRLVKRGKWNRRIGQYNLLISSGQLKLILFRLRPTTVELPGEVKRAIFESFKDLKSPQCLRSYFADTFQCNQDEIDRFSWANELETDTHRILVWHIATSFCEITDKQENSSKYYSYMVADRISKYCAYLLTREPKLVPNNSDVVCSKVFHAVRRDVFRATRRYRGRDIRYWLMEIAIKADDDDEQEETILKQGADLALQLRNKYDGEPDGVWRVLAKFWTGFLLYLAASTKAASHKTHLEGRGELVTHLWALLCHAGLLGSTRRDDLFSEQDVEDAIEADGC